ncbi:uncharacterized protein PF11_0207-like, partial [Stegodyphus dumicola]|uniref:uncharacterized protein PF11_0207-like n=1 Tax=Stegodyphus dumicola TaxID=202533 RepID=UPI0015AFE17A
MNAIIPSCSNNVPDTPIVTKRLRRDIESPASDLVYKRSSVSRKSISTLGRESTSEVTTTITEECKRSWPVKPKKSAPKVIKKKTEKQVFYPVTKYEVDYTNQNYVRSKCNKNKGLHRYVVGRTYNWDVEYDNHFYVRSKVDCPKGLHRKIPTIKRKRLPNRNDLADSTGWEFDYGLEYDQIEGDVPYMPEGNFVTRGGYRFYGVRRNDSDMEGEFKESRKEIKELMKDEFKVAGEFSQEDIPLIIKRKEGRICRGGYRFYDTDRNTYDVDSGEDVDFETSADYDDYYPKRDQYETEYTDIKKGKPFKRTILKKTYSFFPKKSVSQEKKRQATGISFVPGEGSKSFYEGVSYVRSGTQVKKHPSIREVYKPVKKSSSYITVTSRRRRSSTRGDEKDIYLKGEYEQRFSDEAHLTSRDEKRYSLPERRSEEFAAERRFREPEEFVYSAHAMSEDRPRKISSYSESEHREIDDMPRKRQITQAESKEKVLKKVLPHLTFMLKEVKERMANKMDQIIKDEITANEDLSRKVSPYILSKLREIKQRMGKEIDQVIKHEQKNSFGLSDEKTEKQETSKEDLVKKIAPHIIAKLKEISKKVTKEVDQVIQKEAVKHINSNGQNGEKLQRRHKSTYGSSKDDTYKIIPPHIQSRLRKIREQMAIEMDRIIKDKLIHPIGQLNEKFEIDGEDAI